MQSTFLRQPMITVVTPDPEHGMALYVSELVAALAKLGVPVRLCCPANFQYLAAVREAGAQVVIAAPRQVGLDSFWRRAMRNLSFIAQGIQLQWKITNPGDVIHFQRLLHLPLGLIPLLISKMRGASIVLTAHDPLPHRWRLPDVFRWLEVGMLRVAYGLSDRIIVHNLAGKQVLMRSFRQPEDRIQVIPHGHYRAPSSSQYPNADCLRFLLFGAIRENKGVDLAIRGFQRASLVSPLALHLTIVGVPQNAVQQGYWNRCKNLIGESGAIDVIDRRVEDEEIGPLMSAHHAILLPYRDFHSESGVANLALSYRRPIVATLAGGLEELLGSAACGIPIAATTDEAVAEAILQCVALGKQQLSQMGSNGHEYILRERSWESIAQHTAALYSELLHQSEALPSIDFAA